MTIDQSDVVQLICDLSCKILSEEGFADYRISSNSKHRSAEKIEQILESHTGNNFNKDVTKWSVWACENYKIPLGSPEGSLLQAIKIRGKLLKKD